MIYRFTFMSTRSSQRQMASRGNLQQHPFGPGKTVAVIGAGISGVCAAAHLLKQGLRMTVFERSSVAGGVWHYDERVADDPPYPNNTPSQGDYRVSQRGEFAYATPPPEDHPGTAHHDIPAAVRGSKNAADLEVHFSPPGPCYAGLKNNVPTYLMTSVLGAWPDGTEPFVNQKLVEQYIQGLAREHGVDAVTRYHTRVDEVRKAPQETKWEIRSVRLEKCEHGTRLTESISQFDLVVVASGHYNMPRIPDIDGLKEWKAAYPSRVTHSKQYRSPGRYQGQNVLVVGAGVSAVDICRELDGVATKVYQSVRGGPFDLPASLLPAGVERVPEIASFALHDGADSDQHRRPGHGDRVPPGSVVLKDGRVLDDVHHVVLATGYITSYPFLPQLHSDAAPITEAGEALVVTSDGTMAHNLHRDMFYINDPTLAFVGVPYYVATFSLFDFQAQVISRVFAGKARLPSREKMRAEYEKRLKEKGLGRSFHSLAAPGHEIAYVQELVDWVNSYAREAGDEPMQGHSEEWKRAHEEVKAKRRAALGLEEANSKPDED